MENSMNCVWKELEPRWFETGCDKDLEKIRYSSLEDQNWKYCPRCGKPIEEAPRDEDFGEVYDFK